MKHLTLAVVLLALASQAYAAEPTLDTGNTAWMICAAMFVLMMCIPGLALFYGGMVRAKNFLSVFTQLFAVAGVIGILWVLFGYSLVVDTTGSMADELEWLTRDLFRIVEQARKIKPDVDIRYGLITYRDQGDDYVVRNYGFTKNRREMRDWLRG